MKGILIILVAILVLVGCSSAGSRSEAKAEPKRLADMVQHFRDQGMAVGESIGKAYAMIGAVDGFGIEVEGKEIEFYLFDPKTATQETLNNIEDAHTLGKFSAMGFSFLAIINGDMMLLSHENHPQKDRIIQAFQGFR